MDNYAQKGRLGDIARGIVAAPGRLIKQQITPSGGATGWGAENVIGHDKYAKKQYALTMAESLATISLVAVSTVATGPLALFSMGAAVVAVIHANIAANNYKLANINYLFSKGDAAALQAMVSENKKIAAQLEKYKGQQVRDIPDSLRNASYQAIVKQYKTMKKLQAAIATAKAV